MRDMTGAATDAHHSPKRYAEAAIANALGSHGGPGQGSHLTAMSPPPTFFGAIDNLGDQTDRLRNAVAKAQTLADSLVGPEPGIDESKTAGKPAYGGMVGSLSLSVDAISLVINELVHHHGRIERALVLNG